MFHIVLAIASRFLYFGNVFVLQGFARGILALRNIGVISSHFIPALSPPPPIALLGAPVPFVGLPEEIIPPYPSGGLIALEPIERQPPPFASPIPSYQSSLITVSSSQLPIFLPLLIIMLAIISGFLLLLPEIIDFFMNVAKSRNMSKFAKPISRLLPAGPLLSWTIGPVRTHRMSSTINVATYPDALDCHYPAAVRSTGHTGHSDTPSPECDLRADCTWYCRVRRSRRRQRYIL